jgi:uncharacterized surface protein with fasciclin (FAS1) repeats
MNRTRNRRSISAAAAAALLMGSASAIAVIGEHDEQRTDPGATYEQQEGQRDTGVQRDDDWQEGQRDTGMQRDDDWQEGQRDTDIQRDDDWQEGQQDATVGQDDDWQQDQQQAQIGTGQGAQQLEQLAQQHGNLNTFVRAVQEAGMADALVGTTEYTIFAPTDEAFEQADRSVDDLLRPENRDELIALLRGHIVADNVDRQMAQTIANSTQQALTLDGRTVSLQMEEDQIRFGQATVVDQDIQQGNLRIYPVDQFATSVEELAAFEPETAQQQPRDEGMREDTQRRDDDEGLFEGDDDTRVDDDDDWGTQQDTGTGDDW